MLLSCSLLLLSRMACLIYFAAFNSKPKIVQEMIVSSLASDLPSYFVQNVTLALIWQWMRIAALLISPEQAVQPEYQKK